MDHGWHAGSAAEALHLEQLARAWGIPFSATQLHLANRQNREAEARAGRYAALCRLADAQDVRAICLAHHRDDQAETVCLRMLQGAGVAGCRGMGAVRQWRGIALFRPLLHLPKQVLVDALNRHGVPWLEDCSNSDRTLWRNRIRHALFPAMQANGYDPVTLFLRWQAQAEHLSGIIAAQSEALALVCDNGAVWAVWPQWRAAPQAVRANVLQRMSAMLFGEGVVMGRRHLLAVERWLREGANGGLDLSRSRLMRKDGRLLLVGSADRE